MTLGKGFDGYHVPVWGGVTNEYTFRSEQRPVREAAMKVTAKKPCVSDVYEVVDKGSQYYFAKDACGVLVVLAKTEYEPVQDWEDVTANCSLLEDGYGRYSLFHRHYAIHASDREYRVTLQGNNFKVDRKS